MTGTVRGVVVIVLGASIVAVRSLADVVARWLPSLASGAPEPRHNEGRVREQVKAAQRAARAAGVLRR